MEVTINGSAKEIATLILEIQEQLSQDGKLMIDGAVIPHQENVGACKIIPITEKAQKSIQGVPVWKE